MCRPPALSFTIANHRVRRARPSARPRLIINRDRSVARKFREIIGGARTRAAGDLRVGWNAAQLAALRINGDKAVPVRSGVPYLDRSFSVTRS